MNRSSSVLRRTVCTTGLSFMTLFISDIWIPLQYQGWQLLQQPVGAAGAAAERKSYAAEDLSGEIFNCRAARAAAARGKAMPLVTWRTRHSIGYPCSLR